MASLDTWQGIASQETTEGRPAWAGGVPEGNRPTQCSECGNSCCTVERSSPHRNYRQHRSTNDGGFRIYCFTYTRAHCYKFASCQTTAGLEWVATCLCSWGNHPCGGSCCCSNTSGGVCAEHPMIVVRSLITQVILGIDFLQKHGLVLDCTTMPVNITAHARGSGDGQRQELQSIVQTARKVKAKVCAVEAKIQPTEQVIDDCAIPQFSATPSSPFELPQSAIGREARITMLMHCLECLSLKVTKSMPCKRALLWKVNRVQPPLAVLVCRQTFNSSSTMIRSFANYMRNCLRVEQKHHLHRVMLGASHRYAAIAKFGPSSQSKIV